MTIFEFNDYKAFLKHSMKNQKAFGRGAMTRLAEYLGVHPTLVSHVISGPKDFLEEQALPLAEFFGLKNIEQDYLLLLIKIERAGTAKLKTYYRKKRDDLKAASLKLENRIEHERQLSEQEKAKFYSSWMYSAVHLMTTLDGGCDFQMICRRLKLAPEKVRQILDFLLKINMVTEKEEKFFPGVQVTHISKDSSFLVQHHTNWRVKAIEKSESLTDQELMYSVNVSLSQKDFERLREELVTTIQNFIKVVKDSPAEDIAQLNLDFFWL